MPMSIRSNRTVTHTTGNSSFHQVNWDKVGKAQGRRRQKFEGGIKLKVTVVGGRQVTGL